MNSERALIAGIGNIFLGDDAFGSEVAQRLLQRPQRENVRVVDYGIRGFDVAYALMEDYGLSILVDAAPRGGPPGTIYLIEPDPADFAAPPDDVPLEGHSLDPVKVMRLVKSLGGEVRKLLVVGCEPADFGVEDEGRMGLSPPVAEAVEQAIRMIDRVVAEFLTGTIAANSA